MKSLEITRQYHFSAGHRLASDALSPEDNDRIYGPCHRQHGHNYLLQVTVCGEPDRVTGMAADCASLDDAVKRLVLDRVDHHDLSSTVEALAGIPTTGENLARVFWEWLERGLPAGALRRVALVETENNAFEYRG